MRHCETAYLRPSMKLRRAAIGMLSMRGPKYSVGKGKMPVLAAGEIRIPLDSIDTGTLTGSGTGR